MGVSEKDESFSLSFLVLFSRLCFLVSSSFFPKCPFIVRWKWTSKTIMKSYDYRTLALI